MNLTMEATDRWIVGQLTGIRMLERELASALERPGHGSTRDLQKRLTQLNCWLNAVDQELSVRARADRG